MAPAPCRSDYHKTILPEAVAITCGRGIARPARAVRRRCPRRQARRALTATFRRPDGTNLRFGTVASRRSRPQDALPRCHASKTETFSQVAVCHDELQYRPSHLTAVPNRKLVPVWPKKVAAARPFGHREARRAPPRPTSPLHRAARQAPDELRVRGALREAASRAIVRDRRHTACRRVGPKHSFDAHR